MSHAWTGGFCNFYVHLSNGTPHFLLQITGVMTQGRGDGAEWVTSFMVSYSMDAFHWQYVSDQYGNQRVSHETYVSSVIHFVIDHITEVITHGRGGVVM